MAVLWNKRKTISFTNYGTNYGPLLAKAGMNICEAIPAKYWLLLSPLQDQNPLHLYSW